jgi:hypothetical protein
MSHRPRYDRGDWNTICDVCGREYKASQLKQRWDGLKTCNDDWEPRQPQDFVRGVADTQAPPWSRPEQANSFQPVTLVYDNNGQPFISPVVSQTIPSILAQLIRNKQVAATATATATMNRTFYAKPADNKSINGFAVNTVTLG